MLRGVPAFIETLKVYVLYRLAECLYNIRTFIIDVTLAATTIF